MAALPGHSLPLLRCRHCALIAAAASLRFPLRVATYQALIGLLAVTGMRVGEAIRLDRPDLDPAGTRLACCNVQWAFARLAARAGLRPRPASRRPRIHD